MEIALRTGERFMKLRPGIALATLMIVAVGCGDDDEPTPPTLGDLDVVTVTVGDDIDANGYTITVDGIPGPSIGVNTTVTLEDLPAGPYLIGLDGVAVNCDVQNNPRDVDVVAGLTETTQFDVTCAPLPDGPPVAP